MNDRKNYQEILAGEGVRSTKQRKMVLEILEKHDVPLTSEDIYLKIREVNKAISLSTVYRILEIFTSKGLVTKSKIMNDDKARYELNCSKHRHRIICVGCHEMFLIDDCPLEEFEKRLQESSGFAVTGHKLEVYGYCPKCKKVNPEIKPH